MVHEILTKMQKKVKNVLFKPVALYAYAQCSMSSPIMLQETAYYALYSKFSEKMIDSYTCIEYEENMLLAFCCIVA